ncbi:transcriptional activator TenA%2C TENA/THI-4 family protein [Streptococcus pneumoniae]|nr:transcriptional activator TenA%2C TENA/THI-4 family protein [Streptococcus pneumoniae]
MEFTDIAMELSKKAWQASFHHPFILQLQEGIIGNLQNRT